MLKTTRWWLVGCGTGMIVGWFLPWQMLGINTAFGPTPVAGSSGKWGALILIGGVVAVAVGLATAAGLVEKPTGGVVAGLVAAGCLTQAVVVYNADIVGQPIASVGLGLYLSAAASLGATVFGFKLAAEAHARRQVKGRGGEVTKD